MKTEVVRRSHWFKREGTSDKQYDITLERVIGPAGSPDRYIVNGWNGKRGATLKQQPKLDTPSSLADAEAAYEAEVKVRRKKKYDDKTTEVETADGTYVPPERELTASGGDLQLLLAQDEAALPGLIEDAAYVMQEKKNGVRLSALKRGDTVGGYGRDGQPMGFPRSVAAALQSLAADIQLDGESCGATYWVFDCLHDGAHDLTPLGFMDRYARAATVVASMRAAGHTAVALVPCATTAEEKAALVAQLRADNAEGIVAKRRTAAYRGGDSARSTDQIKVKFYETATCRVTMAAKGRKARVIGLEMCDAAGTWSFVGHATTKENQEKPPIGAFVEVRYLHIAQLGGALVEPVLEMVRSDVDASACRLESLKVKGS